MRSHAADGGNFEGLFGVWSVAWFAGMSDWEVHVPPGGFLVASRRAGSDSPGQTDRRNLWLKV